MTVSRAEKKTPFRLGLLVLLAAGAGGLSIYLSSHYYDLRAGTESFKSACNLSQSMNCDAVAASSYAELFPGVPLSSFAAGWYLALLFIYALAYSQAWRREALRGALLMTGLATLASLYYFYVMATVLHTYCLYCLFIDGCNLVSLGLMVSLRPEGTRKAPLDGGKWQAMAGTMLGSVFVAVLALKGLDSLNVSGDAINEEVNEVLASPVVAVSTDDDFPSIGPKNAPITIVEFSDFQCPFCRLGALSLNTVLERYPTQVRIVFRNNPLDASCNRFLQRPMHQFACEAARAAVCANHQGKFQAYYEEAFENQKDLGPGKPAEMAGKAGANVQELAACMASPATTQAISRDIEEGNRLGVESTPTFFVNGHKKEAVSPLPFWSKIIDRLLKNP